MYGTVRRNELILSVYIYTATERASARVAASHRRHRYCCSHDLTTRRTNEQTELARRRNASEVLVVARRAAGAIMVFVPLN